MAATAVQRIVVQATAQDKKSITAKARSLDIPVSELMRRGAFAYQDADAAEAANADLSTLADVACGAAERAGAAIDGALDFIAASNKRIAVLEAKAAKAAPRKSRG